MLVDPVNLELLRTVIEEQVAIPADIIKQDIILTAFHKANILEVSLLPLGQWVESPIEIEAHVLASMPKHIKVLHWLKADATDP